MRKAHSGKANPDQVVVDDFVAYLADHGYPGLQVECRPDEHAAGEREIDAVAGPFAIEHTSIDTVEKQREHTAHFAQAVGGFAKELRGEIPFYLSVTVAWSAVRKGQDWSAIRAAMKDWILTEAPGLPDGHHVIAGDASLGVPFGLHVTKASDRRPGVYFGGTAPEDDTLATRLRKQLDKKAAKLAKYRPTKTTVLLVEGNDILMYRALLLTGIQTAYSGRLPTGVDQVWYADTTVRCAKPVFMDLTPELCP